ncbi:MAG: hypothetical protein V3Q69_05360 [Burkholderia sp.]
MRKDIHKKGEQKARYRVRNWAACRRPDQPGERNIWIDEAVLARIPDAIPTRGRLCLYGDRRCCINRARSVDVYAQWSRGQPPIKSDSRVTA